MDTAQREAGLSVANVWSLIRPTAAESRAGLIADPELAATRMSLLLEMSGVD